MRPPQFVTLWAVFHFLMLVGTLVFPLMARSQTKELTGAWSAPIELQSRCVHATLLRGVNGSHSRIVWWPEPGDIHHSDHPHFTYTWDWDPDDSTSVDLSSFGIDTNLLCAGHSVLPNGDLLTTGGTELGDVGIVDVSRLAAGSTEWESVAEMQFPRWYPTNTTLGSGKVLITAGYKEPSGLLFGGRNGTGLVDSTSIIRMRHGVPWESPTIYPSGTPGGRFFFSMADMGFGWMADSCSEDTKRYATLLYGGESDSLLSDLWGLVWNRDEDTYDWQGPLTPSGTSPGGLCRQTAIYDTLSHTMFMYGGMKATGQPSNTLHRLSGIHPKFSDCTSTLAWDTVAVSSPWPSARNGHNAAYDGPHHRMILFGGRDNTTYFNDVWLLDLSDGTPSWTGPLPVTSSERPEPRAGAAMVWDDTEHNAGQGYKNNRVLLLGGFKGISSLTVFSDTLWSGTISEGNPKSISWRAIPLQVSPNECDLDEVVLNNLANEIPSARADAAMLLQGPPYNRVLLYGGDTTPGQNGGELGDFWELDLGPFTCSTGFGYLHWTRRTTPTANRPGARMGHGLVFDTRPRTALFPEVYDPATEDMSTVTTAKRWMYSYPFVHLLPTGDVFYSGPDTRTAALNLTSGWGSTISSTFSGDTSVWLPTSTGSQVAKFGQKVAPQQDNAERLGFISFGSGSPSWTVRDNGLLESRQDANVTILPDGRALLSGGVMTGFEDVNTSPRLGRKQPLIWDPESSSWNAHAEGDPDVLAEADTIRDYHSIALLLPDATVFTAGGEDTSAIFGGSARRLTGEIFYPPYLFEGDDWAPRPRIVCVEEAIAYGVPFAVTVADTAAVDRITMVRPGSVTHGFDQDQRFVPVTIASTSVVGSNLRVVVAAPTTGNAAPPGDYLVFAFRDSVPSVGAWVRLVTGRSGTLGANEVWSDRDTPIVLKGDLTIPSGKSLTINAGVRILPAAVSPSPKLIVEGTLYVAGTGSDRAVLGGSCGPLGATWQGVVVPQGGTIDVEYADIRDAIVGLQVDSLLQATISVTNTLFRRNQNYDAKIIRASTTNPCVLTFTDNVDSVGNGSGVYLRGNFRSVTFSGNTFVGTGGAGGSASGVFVENTNTSYPPMILSNSFSGFLSGQGIKLGAGKTIVRGNTFANSKYGAYVEAGTHEFTAELSTQTANTFSDHTHSGLYFTGSGTNPKVRRNLISDNYNGAVSKSGAKPDFGTATDNGSNSFLEYDNKCLWNQSTGSGSTISARGNYWDVTCPDDSTEVLTCMVNATYFPSLCTSPLGHSSPLVGVEPVSVPNQALTSVTGSVVRHRGEFLVVETGSGPWETFRVYDVLGRLKSEVPLDRDGPDDERLSWNAVDRSGVPLPAGIYFAVVQNGSAQSRAVRFVVLREGGGE